MSPIIELISLINLDPAAIAVNRKRGMENAERTCRTCAGSNPGKLRVGIDAGSSAQIFAAAFMEKAGLNVIYVPFRGGGERTVALAGGHIDVDFDIVAPMKTDARSREDSRPRDCRRPAHAGLR